MNFPPIPDPIKKFVKIFGSIAALVYFITTVPIGEVYHNVATLRMSTILLLIVVTIGIELASSFGIHFLLKMFSNPKISKSVVIYIENLFINSFIPSRAGSMISMPVLLNKRIGLPMKNGAVVQGTNLAIVASLIGVTALIGIGKFGNDLPINVLLLVCAGTTVYIGFAGVIALAHTRLIHYIPDQLPKAEFKVTTYTLNSTISLIISTLVLVGIRFGIIMGEFGIQFDPISYVLIPTLAYSVNVLPISFSGLGVAEATATSVLIVLGVPPSIAGTVIVLDRTVSVYLPVVASGTLTSIISTR